MILTEKLTIYFILSDFKNNFQKGDKNERRSKRTSKKAF